MRKRLVSILMALCMAVSLLPVQALAADDAYTVGEDTRAKVRLYGGSLVPEENCATLTLADGTVTVYIHTEERLPVVLADTSGKYVGGDLTIYQNVSKPLTVHKAAKSITVADGKRVSELIIAGDANVTITGGRYSKVTVETGGVLQLRGGAVDSLIIKSEGHVSVMDSIVNSVTREDGAHFLGTADREVTTAQGLAAALADSEVSKVILTADVQLTGSRLDVSRYVPVDLNGHVLRSNGSNIVFWVGNGGYLELNDSDPESTHSDFSVKGGIITGGKVPAMGSAFAGGVVVNAGGRFTMNGGTIMGCSSPFYGARDAGGVYVYNGGIFTMKGGTIRDCSAGGLLGAGGVFNEGTIYAEGGTIQDCSGSAGVVNEGTIDASYNAERTVFLTSVSGGGTIKASAKCQVTFLTMYGSTDGTRRVLRGQAVSRPADPTSEGHELLGWQLNGEAYDFSAPVMGDLILMAWWGRSLSGSGTAEEPYQIGNAEELVVFRDIVNGANGRKLNSDACAVLTADIVLNDGTFDENGRYTRGESGMWLSEWTPMGQYERTSTAPEGYGGTFDGQGHTITGLYVSTNAENTYASGLFAQLTGSAVVQNVTVTGYIYVHGVGGGNVGGIAGEANGAAIRNCRNLCDIRLNKVDGSLGGVQINAGGIAGSSSGTIENCRNDGTLRTIAPNDDIGTMGRVGGIVGMSDRGTIRGCVNTGTISGGISRGPEGRHGMGGILGVSFDASLIQDCYNTGSIQEEGRYGSSVNVAGGIVGDMRDGFTTATIRNCYNVGEITGGGSISNEGIVENCWYLTGGSGSGTAKAAAAFADGTVLQALIAGRGDDAHPWDTDCGSKRLAENGMRIPVLAWQGLETVHSGGTATCLEPAACDYCGRSYGDIDPDNHASGGEEQWITTADSHLKKWSCCGAVTVAESGHDWAGGACRDCGYACLHSGAADDGDCTTAVVCAVCGDTVTAAKSGHTWGAWTSDGNDRHTRRCTVNGCRQSETARCSGGTATCVEKAVCTVCGAAYGAVDSKNHTALVKVNGRPATPTQVGYVTCWTCEDCGRYFRDAAGTQEIRKEDASIGRVEAAGASGSVQSARTADEGAVGLWIAAASGAAMALAGAAIRRRRRHAE